MLEFGRRDELWGGANPLASRWRSHAAMALIVARRARAGARRLAAEDVERARRWGLPAGIGVALRAARSPRAAPARSSACARRSPCSSAHPRGSSTRARSPTSARRCGARTAAPRRARSCEQALELAERCAARRARRAGAHRAARRRRPLERPRRRRRRAAHRLGAARRRAGRGGAQQSRDRADAVRHAQDRRDAPRPRLPQARHRGPRRARARARPRLSSPRPRRARSSGSRFGVLPDVPARWPGLRSRPWHATATSSSTPRPACARSSARRPRTTNGELLQVDWIAAGPWTTGPDHIHPLQDERFEVVSGRLGLRVNGVERVLEAATWSRRLRARRTPPGMPAPSEVHALVDFRPALRTETAFETLAGLAQDGKTTSAGAPKNPFRLALVLRHFEDEIYLARPPLAVQRVLIGAARRLWPACSATGPSTRIPTCRQPRESPMTNNDMTTEPILVLGGTGKTGSRVAARLEAPRPSGADRLALGRSALRLGGPLDLGPRARRRALRVHLLLPGHRRARRARDASAPSPRRRCGAA